MNRLFLLGVVIAIVFCTMGVQGLKALREKAQQQDQATEVVRRWKQSYKALASSTSAWTGRYPKLANYKDLLDLHRSVGLERYQLVSDPDTLAITKLEPVTYNGADLALVRVCIASTGAAHDASLAVNAASYQSLLAGIKDLAAQPSVELGGIAIKEVEGTPTAFLSGFCLLLRHEATA